MANNIYAHVHQFHKWKDTMTTIKDEDSEIYNSLCEGIKGIEDDIKSEFNKECPKSLYFLKDIERYSFHDYNLKRAACIYMCYWLFHDSLKEKKYDIQEVYKSILDKYNNNEDEYFKDCMNIFINEDVLNKLKHIYDMYTELKNMDNGTCDVNRCLCAKKCSNLYMQHVEECKHKNNNDFCNELEKVRSQYNEQMINTNCTDGTPKFLPSFQTFSSIKLILSTFVLLIILSIFIIVLHKFIFKSNLRSKIMRKSKQREDIYNECSIMQPSELSCN
ncbi:variable surface protein, partial [Plasmodium gonderi]